MEMVRTDLVAKTKPAAVKVYDYYDPGIICLFTYSTLYGVLVLQSSIGLITITPGRVAQSVGHLTLKSGVLGSISDLATYFRFSFH